MINILKNKDFLIITGVLLFFIIIIFCFSNNFYILGGEGNYFLDFNSIKNLYKYTWLPNTNGAGFANFILNFSITIFDFFSFLQNLNISNKVINIFGVVLVYFLPFVSMYWLLRIIFKTESKIAFLLSVFYIINPISTYHLQGIMFWNIAPLYVLPITFGVIYKFYFKKLKLLERNGAY